MGVGPEQNFTYITALKPKMVFIVDIRRGNLDLQLMYKALFELSADRADFVSRLFSKKRPDGLTANRRALEIFTAYSRRRDERGALQGEPQGDRRSARQQAPLRAVGRRSRRASSTSTTRSTTSARSSTTRRPGGFGGAPPAELRRSDDGDRRRRHVAQLPRQRGELPVHERRSKRRTCSCPSSATSPGRRRFAPSATTCSMKGGTVSAFYLSNVEQYLYQDRIWGNFCRNVATLPLEASSTFIRSVRGGGSGPGTGLNSELGNMQADVKDCGASGQIGLRAFRPDGSCSSTASRS